MTMNEDISEINTKLNTVANDVGWIRKEIEGNGKPGLIRETMLNTEFRNKYSGSISTLKYMFGSGILIIIILTILQILNII